MANYVALTQQQRIAFYNTSGFFMERIIYPPLSYPLFPAVDRLIENHNETELLHHVGFGGVLSLPRIAGREMTLGCKLRLYPKYYIHVTLFVGYIFKIWIG